MNKKRGKLSQYKVGALLFTPALIYLAVLLWTPFVYGTWMSFHNWIFILDRPPEWLGLTNYVRVVASPDFVEVMYNTLVYVTALGFQVFAGLVAALILNEKIPFKNVFAGIIIIGYTMPELASGGMWKLIYDPEFGLLNYYLLKWGIIDTKVPWLTNPDFALAAITLASAWKWWPFIFLILYAAVRGIPEELYDAAKAYGAGVWGRFRYVTFPQIKSALFVVIILRTAWNISKFAEPYQMTEGGPGLATTTIPIYVYNTAFQTFEFGKAYAMGIILLLIILALTFLYIKKFEEMRR